VLTSGGTEACNLGVLGLSTGSWQGARVVTTDVEHPAVAAAIARLSDEGAEVVRLSVPRGRPFAADLLADALDERTRLVALQWVNHETGTILPITEYAAVVSARGIPLFVDACQAFGKLAVDARSLGASALAVAAAKIGGPSGAAALWVERCRELSPTLLGGAQERGRRAGTPDVAAQVGFGAAAAQVSERLREMDRMGQLRDRLEAACVALGGRVNAADGPRVPTVTNVSFAGWRGEHLVAALDIEGLCASSGAACSSGLGQPSPVLLAMHPDEPERASSALRLSLGPETREQDVEAAIGILTRVLSRVRQA
jgi:cysteine desulfurase